MKKLKLCIAVALMTTLFECCTILYFTGINIYFSGGNTTEEEFMSAYRNFPLVSGFVNIFLYWLIADSILQAFSFPRRAIFRFIPAIFISLLLTIPSLNAIQAVFFEKKLLECEKLSDSTNLQHLCYTFFEFYPNLILNSLILAAVIFAMSSLRNKLQAKRQEDQESTKPP